MKIKTLLFLCYLLSLQYGVSQNFNDNQIKKFHNLAIDLTKIDLDNQQNISNLNLILRKDKFRRINKIFGIALGTHSLISTLIGIKMIHEGK